MTPADPGIGIGEIPAETLADEDLREPTKEELLEDLRVALKDTIAGKEGIPAREAIAALRKRVYGDANRR